MTRRDPELWCDDVEWLLRCGDSALGARGTTGAVISILERGGPSSGGMPETDLYTDLQVGFGPVLRDRGTVARARRLMRTWAQVPPAHQLVLVAHYATRSEWPLGVQGQLGQLASVALMMHAGQELERLLKACQNNNRAVVDAIRARAETAVREAHRAWYTAQEREAEAWATQ